MRTPAGIRLVNERHVGTDVIYDVTVTWWYGLMLRARRLMGGR